MFDLTQVKIWYFVFLLAISIIGSGCAKTDEYIPIPDSVLNLKVGDIASPGHEIEKFPAQMMSDVETGCYEYRFMQYFNDDKSRVATFVINRKCDNYEITKADRLE
ncbi:MAG: hypothetical protein KDD61_02925 [Bdellovibrionales bacterium]|nr:hypothetical protein [Bdellovibrionales bacterium]